MRLVEDERDYEPEPPDDLWKCGACGEWDDVNQHDCRNEHGSCLEGEHVPEQFEVFSNVDAPAPPVYVWRCASCGQPLYKEE